MNYSIAILLMFGVSASGEEFQRTFSPKLQQFIASHPGSLPLVTNAVSEAFSNRTARIYYFYTENESVPRASHYYYPSEAGVGILLRENQRPIDEYVCLLYEVINSESGEQFRAICQKAESGEISRKDFPRQILKEEFKAVIRVQGLIKQLKLNAQELAESEECKRFIGCPAKFEDFLDYAKNVSAPQRDAVKEYEVMYDSLRKSQ